MLQRIALRAGFNVGTCLLAGLTLLVSAMLAAPLASASELTVLAAGAVHSTVPGLAESFKQQSGDSVKFTFGTVGVLKAKAESGERADLIILTPGALKDLAGKGLVRGETIVDLGQVGVGIAIPKGAAAPDVSNPDSFKQALLAAPAVFFADPKTASSGIYFVKVLNQLGISEQVLAKAKTYADGHDAMKALAQMQGIGITQMTEILPNPDVQLVGPLPAALQNVTTYSGAVMSHAPYPEAAQALLKYFTGTEGKARFKAAGFDVKP